MMEPRELSLRCAEIARQHKARGLVVMELRELAAFTDYFVICSGASDRQVRTIASAIEEEMAQHGVRPLGVEGMREGRWVLLDYGEVMVHVFQDPVRRFYDLEGLWFEAPRLLEEPFEER